MTSRIVWYVAVAGVLAAGVAAAEEAPAAPPGDLQLLDEAPNYAEALVSQWSGNDVPSAFRAAASDTDHFGRLRDTGMPERLTLDQAIQLALANNTQLGIERLAPLAARAAVRGQQSIFDPSAFGDSSFDRSQRPAGSALLGANVTESHNFNVNGGLRKTLLSGGQAVLSWRNNRYSSNSSYAGLVPQYSTDFNLSLNQPLLRDFGLRFSTLLVRVARNSEAQSVHQLESQVADIVVQVETAYWGLVQANENVRVQEQGLAAARELQRQNEGKFKVGALPQTAVLEAQSEVARREANLIQARNAQSIARDGLRAVINFRRAEADALLMIEPGDAPAVVVQDFDLDKSLATAIEKRAELQVAKLDVQGKGMLLKVAENQLLPRLNAVGSVGTNGLSGTAVPRVNPITGTTSISAFGGPYDTALERAVDGRYYSYSAGVTLEIPLGNARAKADHAQARISLEIARRTLQAQQESVTLEVKKAVTSLQSDLKSIEATRIARELAEENVRNQRARYDVGLATTKDLLDFQDRLTQAQAAEVQALTTYSADLAALRRAEGSLLSARNIRIDSGEEEPTPLWARF